MCFVLHFHKQGYFGAYIRSTSEHNKMVQAAIVGEIVGQPNSKINKETAKG